MAQPYLSIIIPAHNEAERLPLSLIDLDRHLSVAPYSYEILVVNDGSDDKTAKIAESFSRTIKNLKLINNEENSGKGAAVRQGMMLAKGKLRAFVDADNPIQPSGIDEALSHFSAGIDSHDIVIGSRESGSKFWLALPPHRQIAERAHGLIVGALLFGGVRDRIRDAFSGFKVFKDEAAEQIFPQMKISGWGFDLEILALARRLGFKVKEVPILWSHDRSKEMPLASYLRHFVDMAKIRWWLYRGHYNL